MGLTDSETRDCRDCGPAGPGAAGPLAGQCDRHVDPPGVTRDS